MKNINQILTSKNHILWISDARVGEDIRCIVHLSMAKELMKSGWKVTLVSPGKKGWQEISEIPVYGIPLVEIYLVRRILYQIQVILFLIKQLETVDIVYFNELSALGLMFLRAVLRALNVEKPLFIMDTRTLLMQREDKMNWKNHVREFFFMKMNALTNRFGDGRTTITEPMVRSLQIPPEKLLSIWPSGVDIGLFTKAVTQRVWPKDSEPIHLIYIGCMHYERNLMNLCKAIMEANKVSHRFQLTLLGEGNEYEELLAYSTLTNGMVCVMPSVPHDQVAEWLGKNHVGVLPFPDEERFRVSSPIKLFEYLAAGMVVLATKIECHTNVIRENDMVVWCDTADVDGLTAGLEELWKFRSKFAEMGKKNRDHSTKLTWHASAEKLSLGFEKALSTYQIERKGGI